MHPSRRTRRLLVAVPGSLLALSLVGCGLAEDAAKDRVNDALESEGIEADLDDLEDGEFNIDSTAGGASVGELPKDFPTDEVPVVDGEIIGGTYTKNPATWNATIEVGPAGGDKQAAYDDAAGALSGAEVTQEPVDNGTAITGIYTSASYTITLAVTDSNGIVVNYAVSPK